MGDLAQWLGSATATPETTFAPHRRLVETHPFNDGNGRTARLLMNLVLLRGYPPVAVRPHGCGERKTWPKGVRRSAAGHKQRRVAFKACLRRIVGQYPIVLSISCNSRPPVPRLRILATISVTGWATVGRRATCGITVTFGCSHSGLSGGRGSSHSASNAA
jgi:hypothetical protein